MSEQTAHRVIASGDLPSVWYETGPPNGCQPKHTERRIMRVEVYEADYYGRGAKRYARGYSMIEMEDGRRTVDPHSSWQDGNPAAVARWLERIVEVTAAAAAPTEH